MTTTGDSTDLAPIRTGATRLRRAIIATRGAGLISFEYFTAGGCGDASIFLGQYLSDDGFGDWEYVKGDRGSDQHTHAWIEREGILVDITSNQFEGVSAEIVVTRDPSWHSQFVEDFRHPARIDYYHQDDRDRIGLDRAYRIITAAIADQDE
jgi:hypothetical protein